MRKRKFLKLITIIILTILVGGCLPLKSINAIGFWPQPPEPWHWRIQIEIKPGDILYDEDAIPSRVLGKFAIGHTGLYVGDLEVNGEILSDQVIEAQFKEGVNNNPISSWDYPKRDNVYLLRVDTNDENRNAARDFVVNQLGKPYDWHWWQKSADPNSPSWYCSELVWAAYYNQGVDLEHHAVWEKIETPYVSPAEIFADEDTYIVSCHSTGKSFFPGTPTGECPSDNYDFYPAPVFIFASPVDGEVIDPDGLKINKDENQIPGAYYIEDYKIDENKEADLIILPEKKFGQYRINVYPEPGAHSYYSLEVYKGGGEGDSEILAQDKEIPENGQFHSYTVEINSPTFATFGANNSGGGFSDTETGGAFLSAGTLDFSLSTTTDDFVNLTPGEENYLAKREVEIIKNGSLGFWYKVKTSNLSGDCSLLNLNLFLENGTQITQPLSNFETSFIEFSNQTDNLEFKISASGQISQTQTCNFDIKIEGWQNSSGNGFYDKEILPNNHIKVVPKQSSAPQNNIVINEFLPNPIGDECQASGLNGEWVEIYNKGQNSVDLANWYIQDEAGNRIIISNSNTHTGSTIIGPKGSGSEWLVVFLNDCALNNDGDTVYLYDSSDQLIDSYNYSGQAPENKSYARYPDGSDNWYDPIPTPGGPNKLEPERLISFQNSDEGNQVLEEEDFTDKEDSREEVSKEDKQLAEEEVKNEEDQETEVVDEKNKEVVGEQDQTGGEIDQKDEEVIEEDTNNGGGQKTEEVVGEENQEIIEEEGEEIASGDLEKKGIIVETEGEDKEESGDVKEAVEKNQLTEIDN